MLSIVVENRINQFNPWLTYPGRAKDFLDRFLPPEYVHRDAEKTPLRPDRALLVVGPRQSGKSTMIWHLLRQFIPDILFLNMEDPLIRTECVYPLDF
ncbi:MAG: AAA family ATPase, partial [Desulfobacteraceae bacterium]|nr:AAA family ATPase [Desulfobacteraceae bacterium]